MVSVGWVPGDSLEWQRAALRGPGEATQLFTNTYGRCSIFLTMFSHTHTRALACARALLCSQLLQRKLPVFPQEIKFSDSQQMPLRGNQGPNENHRARVLELEGVTERTLSNPWAGGSGNPGCSWSLRDQRAGPVWDLSICQTRAEPDPKGREKMPLWASRPRGTLCLRAFCFYDSAPQSPSPSSSLL